MLLLLFSTNCGIGGNIASTLAERHWGEEVRQIGVGRGKKYDAEGPASADSRLRLVCAPNLDRPKNEDVDKDWYQDQ